MKFRFFGFFVHVLGWVLARMIGEMVQFFVERRKLGVGGKLGGN